jgi:hypothetical protein
MNSIKFLNGYMDIFDLDADFLLELFPFHISTLSPSRMNAPGRWGRFPGRPGSALES